MLISQPAFGSMFLENTANIEQLCGELVYEAVRHRWLDGNAESPAFQGTVWDRELRMFGQNRCDL